MTRETGKFLLQGERTHIATKTIADCQSPLGPHSFSGRHPDTPDPVGLRLSAGFHPELGIKKRCAGNRHRTCPRSVTMRTTEKNAGCRGGRGGWKLSSSSRYGDELFGPRRCFKKDQSRSACDDPFSGVPGGSTSQLPVGRVCDGLGSQKTRVVTGTVVPDASRKKFDHSRSRRACGGGFRRCGPFCARKSPYDNGPPRSIGFFVQSSLLVPHPEDPVLEKMMPVRRRLKARLYGRMIV